MPLKRDLLERQLTDAREKLKTRVDKLKADGVDAKVFKRDPVWRNLDSNCRTLRKRLRAVEAIEAREAECAVRKANKGAEVAVTDE